jgi:hypothetical protein
MFKILGFGDEESTGISINYFLIKISSNDR